MNELHPLILSQDQVLSRVESRIKQARNGELVHYRTRWKSVNKLIDHGFLLPTYLVLGAPSSVGKSLMGALLREDFSNPQLNQHADNTVFLHFGWDMAVEFEMLRSLQRKVGKSINQMLNVDEQMTPASWGTLEAYFKKMKKDRKNTWFVEKQVTPKSLGNLIDDFVDNMPEKKVIVSVDHSLLALGREKQTDNDLVQELSGVLLDRAKQYTIMCILLSQFNSEIEDSRRIDNPAQHYPMKKDFFGSKTVFHDADVVWGCHRPELLGIREYGPKKYKTQELFALHQLKYRNFEPGMTMLKFVRGMIYEHESSRETTEPTRKPFKFT
jgi:replicative DNA helicase